MNTLLRRCLIIFLSSIALIGCGASLDKFNSKCEYSFYNIDKNKIDKDTNIVRVIIYNSTLIFNSPYEKLIRTCAKIAVYVDKKKVDNLPAGQYLQFYISKKEFELSLSHFDAFVFNSEHKIKATGKDIFIDISATTVSNSAQIVNELPVRFYEKYRPKIQTSEPMLLGNKKASDSVFLSFSGTAQCKEYGKIKDVKATKIYYPGFLCYLEKDKAIYDIAYPMTHSQIGLYIASKFKIKKIKTDDLDSKLNNYEDIQALISIIKRNAIKGTGSPLEWGVSLSKSLFGDNEYLYIPLGIERESEGESKARLYSLLVNNKGEIVHCKIFPYNADDWKIHISKVMKDIDRQLLTPNKMD